MTKQLAASRVENKLNQVQMTQKIDEQTQKMTQKIDDQTQKIHDQTRKINEQDNQMKLLLNKQDQLFELLTQIAQRQGTDSE